MMEGLVMRRTPKEDIEFVLKCISTDRARDAYSGSSRWFHQASMSLEFTNILISMGLEEDGKYGFKSFTASDETYLKAIEILKLIIEEGE